MKTILCTFEGAAFVFHRLLGATNLNPGQSGVRLEPRRDRWLVVGFRTIVIDITTHNSVGRVNFH
jgi:hypothetical protein